jgi:hypothetical protein
LRTKHVIAPSFIRLVLFARIHHARATILVWRITDRRALPFAKVNIQPLIHHSVSGQLAPSDICYTLMQMLHFDAKPTNGLLYTHPVI